MDHPVEMKFLIKNLTGEANHAELFGFNKNYNRAAFGCDMGVSIIPENTKKMYIEYLLESVNVPFKFKQVVIESSLFIYNRVILFRKKILDKGYYTEDIHFEDGIQFGPDYIKEASLRTVDGNTHWEFELDPYQEITVTIKGTR